MAEDKKALAMKELARRELNRRAQNGDIQQGLAGAEEIGQRPGIIKRTIGKVGQVLPEAGQLVGGVGGTMIGGLLGHPVKGGAIGGTAGRGIGLTQQQFIKQLQDDPIKAIGKQIMFGNVIGPLMGTSDTEKKKMGKEVLATAGTEAILAPFTAMTAGAGKGILKGLLGPRVAERGIEKGFKGLLNPKFFKNRVPKEISTKVNKFFGRLDKTVGSKVERAVLSKRNVEIPFAPIKQGHKNLLKELSAESIDDLSSLQTTTAQKNRLRQIETMINRVQQDKVSLPSAWKMRKLTDKVAFNSGALSDDAKEYVLGVRKLFSEPIRKRGGKEVNKQFGRYSFVQQQKQVIRNNFDATVLNEGRAGQRDIFAPKIEQFANNILGTNKDETVRGLAQLDKFLAEPSERIVEDLLDVAAAESFSKNIELMGLFSRGLIGSVGGRKAIAGTAANFQSPVGRTLRGLINRGIAAGGTGLVTGGEQQAQQP